MPWIVLHHVPPKNGLRVSGGELEASALLAAYQPDYLFSGHDHAFPYESGQGWNQKLADSRLLVSGQLLRASFSKLYRAGYRIWRTLLAHCQQYVDTGR